MKKLGKWIKILIATILLLLLLSFYWSWHVGNAVKSFVYNDVGALPKRHAGVLLGTAKYAHVGEINLYYKYRMQATQALWRAQKISYLIVSGDNSTMQYNEPTVMKKDLVELGIPEDRIYEDFAGFRTLDSMIRSKKVFGQERVVVISQRFHVERALFIAHARGIDAIGFCARDVDQAYGAKTRVREHFARIKLFVDLYLLNKQPKFLGDPVQIPS